MIPYLFLYSYVLTVPHSAAFNLAYPAEVAEQDNFASLSKLQIVVVCDCCAS